MWPRRRTPTPEDLTAANAAGTLGARVTALISKIASSEPLSPRDYRDVYRIARLIRINAEIRKPKPRRWVPILVLSGLLLVLIGLYFTHLSRTHIDAHLRTEEVSFRLTSDQVLNHRSNVNLLAITGLAGFQSGDQSQILQPRASIRPTVVDSVGGQVILEPMRFPAGTTLKILSTGSNGVFTISADHPPRVIHAQARGNVIIGTNPGRKVLYQESQAQDFLTGKRGVEITLALADNDTAFFNKLDIDRLSPRGVRLVFDPYLDVVDDPTETTGTLFLSDLKDRERKLDSNKPLRIRRARGVITPTFDGHVIGLSFTGTVGELRASDTNLMPSLLEYILLRPELMVISVLLAIVAVVGDLRKVIGSHDE